VPAQSRATTRGRCCCSSPPTPSRSGPLRPMPPDAERQQGRAEDLPGRMNRHQVRLQRPARRRPVCGSRGAPAESRRLFQRPTSFVGGAIPTKANLRRPLPRQPERRRPLLLLAHTDVVEAKSARDWTVDPFTLTERGRATSTARRAFGDDKAQARGSGSRTWIRYRREGFTPDRDNHRRASRRTKRGGGPVQTVSPGC